MAARNEHILTASRNNDASDGLCRRWQLHLEQVSIPELEGTVIGNCNELSIIDFDHLVDAWGVFFNALDRCEFDAFVSVLDTEVIIFDLWLNLAEKVDRATT